MVQSNEVPGEAQCDHLMQEIAALKAVLKPFAEIVENWHAERHEFNASKPPQLHMKVPAPDDHVCMISMEAKDLYAIVAALNGTTSGDRKSSPPDEETA